MASPAVVSMPNGLADPAHHHQPPHPPPDASAPSPARDDDGDVDMADDAASQSSTKRKREHGDAPLPNDDAAAHELHPNAIDKPPTEADRNMIRNYLLVLETYVPRRHAPCPRPPSPRPILPRPPLSTLSNLPSPPP